MVEYKVLTERDSRLSGRFDPDALETALNSYAAEGWRVVQSFVAASLWKSLKTEIVVILERDSEARSTESDPNSSFRQRLHSDDQE